MTDNRAINPCSDVANAERFAERNRKRLFFLPQSGWHYWTGTHWAFDPFEAERRAQEIGRLIFQEAENISALAQGADTKEARARLGEEAAKLNKFAYQCETASKVAATMKLASARMVMKSEDLDTDPWLLNLTNGTLDLRSGDLKPHDPADLITRCVGVPYLPDAACPLWERSVHQVFDGDADLVAYIQRVLGYCLTGSVREQVFFILYGGGANGKNTIVGRLQEILGDYQTQTAPNLLIRSKTERHPTEVWDLRGARLAVASEINAANALNESLVKRLVGDDVIKARGMYQDFGEFTPSHKILMLTNHKPVIKDEGHAIWRRIHLIPFKVKFKGANRDNDLPEKLKAEYPGILRWCVDGCREYLRQGLNEPHAVIEATKEYRTDSDVLALFFEERCRLGQNEQATAHALFNHYRAWCSENGEPPQTQTWLGRRLGDIGLDKQRTASGIIWRGIGLRDVRGM